MKKNVNENTIKVGYVRQEHFDPRMLKITKGPVTRVGGGTVYAEPQNLPANTREAHVNGSLYLAKRDFANYYDLARNRQWWNQELWGKKVLDGLVEHSSNIGMALSRSGHARMAYHNKMQNITGQFMISQIHFFHEESFSQLFKHDDDQITCYDSWYHRWKIDRNSATLTLSTIGAPIGYALSKHSSADFIRNRICNNYSQSLLGSEVDVGECEQILESYGYFLTQLQNITEDHGTEEYKKGHITNFSPDVWATKQIKDNEGKIIEEDGYTIEDLHDPIDNSLISEVFRGITLKNGWPPLKEQENVCLPKDVGCNERTMSYPSTLNSPAISGECRSLDETGSFVSEIAKSDGDCLSCFDPSFEGGELAGFMKACNVDEDCKPPYYCIEFTDKSESNLLSGEYSEQGWNSIDGRKFCALPRFFSDSASDQAECERLGGTMNIGGPISYDYGFSSDSTACYWGINGDMVRFCGRWSFSMDESGTITSSSYNGPCFWRDDYGRANLTRLIPARVSERTFECIAVGCATCYKNMYCVPEREEKQCPSGHECIEAQKLHRMHKNPPLTPMCVLRQIFDNYWYINTVDLLNKAGVSEGILSQFIEIKDQIQSLIRDSKLPDKFVFASGGAHGYVDDLYMHIKSSPDESENKTGIYFLTATEPPEYGDDERQGEIWVIFDIDTSEEHRGGISFSGLVTGNCFFIGSVSSDLNGRIPENSDHLYYRIILQPYFSGRYSDPDNRDYRKVGDIKFVIKGMELLRSLDPEVFATRDDVYLNFDCEPANSNWVQSNCFGIDPEKTIYEQFNNMLGQKLGNKILPIVSSILEMLLKNPAVAYPLVGQRCYPDPYYWDNFRENVTNAMAVGGNLSNPGGFEVIYWSRGRTCDPFYSKIPGIQDYFDIKSPGELCDEKNEGCYDIDHEE